MAKKKHDDAVEAAKAAEALVEGGDIVARDEDSEAAATPAIKDEDDALKVLVEAVKGIDSIDAPGNQKKVLALLLHIADKI